MRGGEPAAAATHCSGEAKAPPGPFRTTASSLCTRRDAYTSLTSVLSSGGVCRVRERCGTTAGDNKRQPRGQRPTEPGRAVPAVGGLFVGRPLWGPGGDGSAAAITTLQRRAAGEARPMARAPHHPTSTPLDAPPRTTQPSTTPAPLHSTLEHFPPRYLTTRQSGVFLSVARIGNVYTATVASAANVSRGTCTLLRPSSPTLGTSGTLSPADSPPITTPFDSSSSKAIDVMIYYIYVTLLVLIASQKPVENTTGPKRFSNSTYKQERASLSKWFLDIVNATHSEISTNP